MKNDSEKKVGYLRIAPEVSDFAEKNGHLFCVQAVFSSAIRDANFIRAFVKAASLPVRVFTSDFPSGFLAVSNAISEKSADDYRFILTAHKVSVELDGRYLCLASSCLDSSGVASAQIEVSRAAGFLRLVLGDTGIRAEKYRAVYEKKENSWKVTTTVSIGSDHRQLLLDHNVADCEARPPYEITPAAAEYLMLLEPNQPAHLRFMLLWNCLEAQLTSRPGREAGKRRGYFAIDELKSSEINRELKRLHGLRSKLFKEGDFGEIALFDEFSLRSILRMSALGPSPLRDRFVELHVERLRQPYTDSTSYYETGDLYLHSSFEGILDE